MKQQTLIALMISLTFFFGCQDSVYQEQGPLMYQGKEVLETTPSFVILEVKDGVMAKAGDPEVQIEANPPYGTVFGNESDSGNVYLSQGSEMLPAGSWIDQVNGEVFTTTLLSNSTVSFVNATTITITGATDCEYLNVDDEWVSITGDATVTAKAVSIDENGTCTIETSDKILMGHGGTVG